MKKITIIYLGAIVLIIFSFLSFNRVYKEFQIYSVLTNGSIVVVSNLEELSRQITNAAVINPRLIKEANVRNTGLFFTDSSIIIRQITLLKENASDSINISLAKKLDTLVRAELSWLLQSNVPDSILHHQSPQHIATFHQINSLIGQGLQRTNYLFGYRDQKLNSSILELKLKILIFLGLGCGLLVYTSISLLYQRAKRQEKEKELDEKERKFGAMVENSHDLIVIVDDYLKVLYRSPSAERITGFTNKEREENSTLDDIHPDDKEKIKSYLAEMKLNPGKVVIASYRLKHKQGHYIWLEGTFTSLFHNAGLKGVVINLRDVSEQKAAEQELIKSENRFRQTLENMMEGVQIIGFDWRYIYVNDALTKYSTYKREEMIGRSVMELYPGIEQTALYTVLKTCLDERTNQQLESEFVFPNGTKKYFDLSIQPAPEGIFILSVDISDRKEAEDNLQKNIKELSEYKYALDESSIVAITDQKGIIRHVNDNFCKISRYNKEDLIGQDHRLINSGYHSKEFIRGLWTTIAHGNTWKGELKNKASDGTIYWVDTTIIPFLNDKGKPYQYLAIRNDITERKKGEQEIIKLNRLYAFISAINQSIVHIEDEEKLLKKACDIAIETGDFKLARIEMLNADGGLELASISGNKETIQNVAKPGIDYTPAAVKETPIGKALRSGTYEVNNDLCNDPALESLRGIFESIGIRSAISLPLKRAGKIIGFFNLSSSQKGFFDHREVDLLLEAAGDISFALEITQKENQRRKAERQLQSSESKLKRAQSIAHIGHWEIDFASGIALWSEECCRIYGLDALDNKKSYEDWMSFVHPEDIDHVLSVTKIQQQTMKPATFDHRIVKQDGSIRFIHSESQFEIDPAGKPLGLYGITHDITNQKLSEENLRRSTLQLKEAQALSHTSNWEIDMIQNVHFWSDEFYSIFGIDKEEGTPSAGLFLSFIHPDDRAHAAFKIQEAFDSLKASSFHFRFTTKDGVLRYGFTKWEFEFNRHQKPTRLYGILQDITERKQAELEREKMISDLVRHSKNLEQFAYVVSHNLRAPVANIIGLCNLLNSGLPDKDKELSQQYLLKAVSQLDIIVKDLNNTLEVRAQIGHNRENVNFIEIVEGIKDSIYETIVKEQVKVKLDMEVESVTTIKSYLYSIFYNLITNSIKYKQAGKNPLIRISTKEKDGKIIIVFRDNGMGMNLVEYGSKVFGLYQRFHLNIAGKGMGLFMVKTQTEALEGTISVISKPGEGTEFTVELPLKS